MWRMAETKSDYLSEKILIIAWKVYLRESRLEAGRLYNSLGVGWQDLHNTTSPEEVFNNFMLIVCYFTWCIYHNTLTLLFFLIYILLGSIYFIFYLRLNFPWRIKEKYNTYWEGIPEEERERNGRKVWNKNDSRMPCRKC